MEIIMDRTFQKFLQSKIDLSSVGVEFREDNAPYFCTPKGASIFGWAGVDGIHFCFIRGFGNMVFAISPMNSAPDFVHPLARNFADFLRLLLACSDEAALERNLKPFCRTILQRRNSKGHFRSLPRK